MVVGEKIKYLRERKDLDQKELARLVGCNQSTISSYETSKYNSPNQKILKELAYVLGVSVEYLQNSDTEVDVTCNERIYSESKTIGNLIKTYRKLERLSQNDLAVLLDVSDNTISKIETGNINILNSQYKVLRENLIDLYPNLKNYIQVDGIKEIALDDVSIKDTNDIMTLGEKIRRLRTTVGLTLRQLSKLTDRAASSLNCYEKNTIMPDNECLDKIAKALNTTTKYLLEGTDMTKKSYNMKKAVYPYKEVGDIIKKYRVKDSKSQIKLAKLLNCNINKVSRIELGHYNIFNTNYRDIKIKLFEIFPKLEKELLVLMNTNTNNIPKKLYPIEKDNISKANLLTNHKTEDKVDIDNLEVHTPNTNDIGGHIVDGYKDYIIGKEAKPEPNFGIGVNTSIKYKLDEQAKESELKNQNSFDQTTSPFINRYSCVCGNLNGRIHGGMICDMCHTVVKYIDEEKSTIKEDTKIDIFKDFELVKPNMSILYFDYIHGN